MMTGDIGCEVARRRKALGLSQEAIAQQAGISRNYLSLIERGGAQNITIDVLKGLATALNVPPMSLLEGKIDSDELFVPPSLREFGIRNGLSFKAIHCLATIQWERPPASDTEWQQVYEALAPHIG